MAHKFPKHSTYSTYSTFPQKESTYSTLQRKKHIFRKNASYSCHVECFWKRGSVSSKNIQHIQHIQHFPRKKHIFQNHTKNMFNIFAERSTFLKKMLLSAVMLNVVSLSGNWGVQKGSVSSKTFNIFNISPERSIFFERGF